MPGSEDTDDVNSAPPPVRPVKEQDLVDQRMNGDDSSAFGLDEPGDCAFRKPVFQKGYQAESAADIPQGPHEDNEKGRGCR